MGRIKDDERRLRAAIANHPNPNTLGLAMRLGIKSRRMWYLFKKIEGKSHRMNQQAAKELSGLSPLDAPQPSEETTEPTEEQDGEFQGQERAGLDDQAGRAEDSADSD